MSTWQEESINSHAKWERDYREEQREARNAILARHSPPYDPLHDNAARLREIVGLVLEHYEYAVVDEEGEGMIYLPLIVPPDLAVQLQNAHRASMGRTGR